MKVRTTTLALALVLLGCQTSPVSQQPQKARNVILFVGDGMSADTVTAARIYAGQRAGNSGEAHALSFERFPYVALSKTYNVDAQIPDSAGTMTAMMTGVKTRAGLIGLSEAASRGDCESQTAAQMISALALAEMGGMRTGIVTTARLTHATPAAAFAHSVDRDWESDSDMTERAKAAGCVDIASQFVAFEQFLESQYQGLDIDGIEIALGGGRRSFLPERRDDGRDLIAEWQALYPDGAYVSDEAGLRSVSDNATHVLGLFESSHARYHADRANDPAGEPSLSEQTQFAIQRLSGAPHGFFLIVEAGRIDHAHHAGNASIALDETVEFARAIELADALTSDADTLLIVTADHSHTMTMAGYPPRGNPILGTVPVPGRSVPQPALDQQPYTTLSYANGRGAFIGSPEATNPDARYAQPIAAGRQNLADVDTESHGFHQEALVPLDAETHGGDDVAIYAKGPGSSLVQGVLEQHVIFHVMNHAAGLSQKAEDRLD